MLEFQKEFQALANDARPFGDIDTYAKYLNILNPGGKKIKTLKKIVSQFFSIKQLITYAKDQRYLPWLISIMNNKTFPDNIKVLNWNYDFQVQLAFSNFQSMEDVEHRSGGFTHSGLALQYYPNLDPTYNDDQLLSLIHLNGIAGYIKQEGFYTASTFQNKNKTSRTAILNFLKDNQDNPQINFAWENNEYHPSVMKRVKDIIKETTILVVIGYSFPFFNRKIDKQIFTDLKINGNFKKIYYQDPVLTGQQLISQFNLGDIDIVHIPQIDNFYIPFEY